MRLQFVTLLLFLMGLRTMSDASCTKARPDQTPHGANELVILEEQTVSALRGVVSFGHSGIPAAGVVVELYQYEGGAHDLPESLQGAKRSEACITTGKGHFSFPVNPGRYILRAGTVRSMGMNEVYAIFKVTQTRKTRDIEIHLPPGF